MRILTLNGGSSSLKFALYDAATGDRVTLGRFDRLGSDGVTLSVEGEPGAADIGSADHKLGVTRLLDWLDQRYGLGTLGAVGHRIVHGGPRYRQAERIDSTMMDALRQIADYAPEHLPAEIDMIDACRQRLPEIVQVACFDTAFHRDLPMVSRLLAIPRKFADAGVERYGFHGLSYTYLLEELGRIAGPQAAKGRVILAHLGNGASLAAVKGGKSVDTTMGFTPAAGIPMGTRAGDLDPGLVLYFARREAMDANAFDHMVNHQSGLLGVSGTSGDVRDLLGREAEDRQAAEAIALFCYRIRKTIGAFAAALGGIDTLVFSGGIGENASAIRERICEDLGFLGITLDTHRNADGAGLISAGAVAVRVIPTNEEAIVVEAVRHILNNKDASS
jgi:acetate kinase